MYFDTLPNEIITQVFLSLPSIASAINLSSTCHRFRNAYQSSKKLEILQGAADAELGPIEDIVQLLTQNASQPAHLRRRVPMSEALLHQVIKTGRIAQKYEDIYPSKKWKVNFANRRLLLPAERFVLRRALYRLWLYSKAFHTPTHVRTCRSLPEVMRERAALLHNFSTVELAEMLDVHAVIRDMVANNICPSNGRIRQKFQNRYPESNNQILFNIHLNYPSAPFVTDGWVPNASFGKYQSRLSPNKWHDPGAEGWGDDISHYYIIEDYMKLDPEQLLYLRDNCHLKAQVESHVRGLGEYFGNNGETFSETLGFVVKQRGCDLEVLRHAVEDGEVGVALEDD